MRRAPAQRDFDGWVSQLGFSSTRQRARVHLSLSGAAALPALRRGLRHRKAIVRRQCVRILDRLVDDEALPELVLALDDDDPGVRARAFHALSCDRCKEHECRPAEDLWVPRAVDVVANDPNPDLRAAAIDALGKVVRHRPEAAAVLTLAAECDPDKGLRGMARWRAQAAGQRGP